VLKKKIEKGGRNYSGAVLGEQKSRFSSP